MLLLPKRLVAFLIPPTLLAAWVLTIEGEMVVHRHPVDAWSAHVTARNQDALLRDVSMSAGDGAQMRGWFFTPAKWGGRAVLLVHGGSCSARMGMLPRVEWLLKSGYACLVVDLRGCGNSGGEKSWGLKEPGDMVDWATWLRAEAHASTVFAHGVSRGSTVLIQSLALHPALDGLAAQSAGTGNLAHPYQQISERLGVSEDVAKWTTLWFIEPSFAWVRWKHGLDFRQVISGVAAIKQTNIPVLLMHGTADEVTPFRGAQRLRDANPEQVELMTIPGAGHDLYQRHSRQVMERMLEWMGTIG